MALEVAKVFRNVEIRIAWLGLEPVDWFGLGALAWLLVLVNRQALSANFLLIAVLATALRIVKRGKPEHHSLALVQFYLLRRPFLSAAAKDQALACVRSAERGAP